MENNYISREVHEEFSRYVRAEHQRLADENDRQNKRLSVLEETVKEIHTLTVSVERMAVNMENMLSAIERQGNLIEKQNNEIDKQNTRIDEIKNAPDKEQAKDYKQIKTVIITTIITAVITAFIGALISII